jgi:hypothetical protein
MALWQLYGGASGSLAITTTVAKLHSVTATWSDQTSIHRVRYIDHFNSPTMQVGRYIDVLECKHKAYSFEKEVRVIVSRHDDGVWQKNPIDLRLQIPDLSKFILSVVVAPEADDSYFENVREVTQRFGVSSPVLPSKLTTLPR